MNSFRYTTTGHWYKGNTHIHSTSSDGGKDFAELAHMYSEQGYQFLFHTDHWVLSDVSADATQHPLLFLDGIELDGCDHGGSYYHVVCLGAFAGIDSKKGFVAAMESARAQGGFLILAHPHWTGNSMEDALRWRFHGVEVYNHVCRWLNGKSDGAVHWNAMLQRFPDTLAFAVDDAHICPEHPGWDGGWIMVNAPTLSRDSIMAAIRAGNFYSSCGPEFHSIEHNDHKVTLRTSPVQFVRLVGAGARGCRVGSFDGQTMTQVTLDIPQDWSYVYAEVEDSQGRRAWTNTLFKAG
jgi:hypothetical protein